MTDQATQGVQTTTEPPGDVKQSGEGAATGEGATLLGAGQGSGAAATGGEGGATDGGKPPEGDAGKGEGDGDAGDGKPEGAPEKYEFTMPEGFTLDEGLAKAVDPVLRELNLTNEQANKLAGVFAQYRESEAKAAGDAFRTEVEGWSKAVQDDPDMGGKHFETTSRQAQSAIAAFGNDGLRALLNETGLGNHPELVRFCSRVGKALGEDTATKPATGGGERSIEERMGWKS